MKCAMEMKVAVETKLLNEEIERVLKAQKLFEERMEHYLTEVMPKLNAIVEERLLQGNGTAVLMVDVHSDGFYFLGYEDYEKYPKNPYPFWELRRDKRFNYNDIFNLEHYKTFLENLCYKVVISESSFIGSSSSGKRSASVNYIKVEISIPKELNCE